MRIAIAGGSGFIGSNIQKEFKNAEWVLLNRADLYGDIQLLSQKIKGVDMVMNFAGYTVSSRWTAKNRSRILESRVVVTENLVSAINDLERKPKTFINASAIGIYANGGSHDESSREYGKDFLATVVQKWEAALDGLDKQVKLMVPRIGLVLGKEGGAFPRLHRIFKWGIGGQLGSGRQIYSFIHIYDLVKAIRFLTDRELEGIYNLTAPNPVSNKVFTKALGKSMKRPAILPVPAFAMKALMGEAAAIVLDGAAVFPKRLEDEGYKFTFATIENTLANLVSTH